jgi:hypothetical protein
MNVNSPDDLFQFCNTAVLPGWILLMAAPRWPWTQRIAGRYLPLALAALYSLIFIRLFTFSPGDFGTLESVRRLFENSWVLLGGWVHYLAFDLFVGAWESRDAQRLGIPRLAVIPCLILTFLLGPLGWLTYMILRYVVKRETEL